MQSNQEMNDVMSDDLVPILLDDGAALSQIIANVSELVDRRLDYMVLNIIFIFINWYSEKIS